MNIKKKRHLLTRKQGSHSANKFQLIAIYHRPLQEILKQQEFTYFTFALLEKKTAWSLKIGQQDSRKIFDM